ncbi:hypothetical protein RHMOL_Rhmol07G0080100 [Rhododendron molle]|uniref:Uncharacterized protein n=1 Tax=Rhododendron molle TaxID=49168 RepID=A0ACC0MZS1_RHOML|nr:hypothetical protein RHMOL_Rhmol07G0080100 [Rhododendron molle]
MDPAEAFCGWILLHCWRICTVWDSYRKGARPLQLTSIRRLFLFLALSIPRVMHMVAAQFMRSKRIWNRKMCSLLKKRRKTYMRMLNPRLKKMIFMRNM